MLRNGIHCLVPVSMAVGFCLIQPSEITSSLPCGGSLNRPVHECVLLDVHLTVVALHTFRKGSVTLICRLRLDVIEI